MFTLYGIPNCDTVKKAKAFLEKKKVSFEFIDFKKIKPTDDDIKRWEEAFGELPVNTKGATYRKLKDEYEGLGANKKLKFLQDNTSMIKRPILEKKGKVLSFGFDEDKYSEIK